MLTASLLCCKGLVGQKVVVVAGFSKGLHFCTPGTAVAVMKTSSQNFAFSVAGLPQFVLPVLSRHASHHAHKRGMEHLKIACRPHVPVLGQQRYCLLLKVHWLTSPSFTDSARDSYVQDPALMDIPPEHLRSPEDVCLSYQSCEKQPPVLQDAAQRQLEGQQEKQERAARRVQKLQRDLRSAGLQQQA